MFGIFIKCDKKHLNASLLGRLKTNYGKFSSVIKIRKFK